MKNIFFAALTFFTIGCGHIKSKIAIGSDCDISFDSFENQTTLRKVVGRGESLDNSNIKISLRTSSKISESSVALDIQYRGNDWLFINGFKISGEQSLLCKKMDSDVVGGGSVYEFVTCYISKKQVEHLALKPENRTRVLSQRGYSETVIFGDEIKKFLECEKSIR